MGRVGPTGDALHGNLDTLAFAEAHGLAAALAMLMILRRRDGWAGWHVTAALVHVLLGGCNLVFWRLFETWDFVTAGVLATAMHGVFAMLELGACFTGPRPSRRPQ